MYLSEIILAKLRQLMPIDHENINLEAHSLYYFKLLLPLAIFDNENTKCKHNLNLPNGQIRYLAKKSFHLAKTSCDAGYEFIGSEMMYCHGNENWKILQWQSQFQTCRGISL